MIKQDFVARVYTRRARGNLLIMRLEANDMAELMANIGKLNVPPDTVVEIISSDEGDPQLCYASDLTNDGTHRKGSTLDAPERPISRDSLEFAATAEFAELCERHRQRGVLNAEDCSVVRELIERAVNGSRPID